MELSFIIFGTTNDIPRSIGIDEGDLSVIDIQVCPNPASAFIHFHSSIGDVEYRIFDPRYSLVLT